MYLILKSKYYFEIINNISYIKKLDENLVYEITIDHKINITLLNKYLNLGMYVQKETKEYSNEEKAALSLFKSNKEFFTISYFPKDINFEINCRNLFLTMNSSNLSSSLFSSYIQKFNNTNVTILSDNYTEMAEILKENKIHTTSKLKKDSDILICEDLSLVNFNYNDIRDFDCIIPFSPSKMTLGHCIFREIDFEIFLKNFNKYEPINIPPSISNLNILYYQILNTVLHVINNIHQEITIDVGLPINKELKFLLPQNILIARPII